MHSINDHSDKIGTAETDHLPTVNALKDLIIAALKTIFDPEIPVNIYDLGLIYNIEVINKNPITSIQKINHIEDEKEDSEKNLIAFLEENQSIQNECQAHIQMTLTSPMCPVAQTFPQTVQERILQVEGLSSVTVELIWDPPWTKEMMSETAKFELNMF